MQTENYLTISIELNELSNPEIKKRTEGVIRGCIGDRPKDEDWKVWIYSSSAYCQVTVKGPSQTRGKFFFDHDDTLPEQVREWLDSYPFR
jgi:hypothetical protein